MNQRLRALSFRDPVAKASAPDWRGSPQFLFDSYKRSFLVDLSSQLLRVCDLVASAVPRDLEEYLSLRILKPDHAGIRATDAESGAAHPVFVLVRPGRFG